MRYSRIFFAFAIIGMAAPQYVLAEEPCRNRDALGVSRTVEIDTAKGGVYGAIQYAHAVPFLADQEVVLTFDDGPFPETTPAILEALAEQCTKATFFYVGRMALRYPGILAQVDQAGHTIAAHTWSHANLRKLPGARGQAEIEKGISLLQARIGHPVAPFFRFPYLSDPKSAIDYLGGRDIAVFSADVDSWDSHGLTPSARIITYVMSRLKKEGRGIILMHDIKHTTAAALPEILKQLKAGGFKIVNMVAKAPATTLAPYDNWAAKMIEQHDAGVDVASQDVPVSPDVAAARASPVANTQLAANTLPIAVSSVAFGLKHAPSEASVLLAQDAERKHKALVADSSESTLSSAAIARAVHNAGAVVVGSTLPKQKPTVVASLDHRSSIIVDAAAGGLALPNSTPPIATSSASAPARPAVLKPILKQQAEAPKLQVKVAAIASMVAPAASVDTAVLKPVPRHKVGKPVPLQSQLTNIPAKARKPVQVAAAAPFRPAKTLRALRVAPAWVAVNDVFGGVFTNLPVSKK